MVGDREREERHALRNAQAQDMTNKLHDRRSLARDTITAD
jgi:hypothetical protein